MGLFKTLNLAVDSTIDWEMTPEYTFGTFESWGGRERVRSSRERIYYFFIDNWGESPKLCLMERGIKHARVVAEINAPSEMVRECVESQGKVALFERSFAINAALEKWLKEHILESGDSSLVIPLETDEEPDLPECSLPNHSDPLPDIATVTLPSKPAEVNEKDIAELLSRFNFYDAVQNPEGECISYLVDNGDGLTVTDMATGLAWQRYGVDIMSYRMMQKEIERLNRERFAGHADWRLPSMAEALSLMQPHKNEQHQHIHPCFSPHQPFIFVDATRKPGGYWFVDYKQGRSFWASGTIPGGFGRLCRSVR